MKDCKAHQLMGAYVNYSILVLLFFSSSPVCVQFANGMVKASSNHPKLLLVSLDGFGWNFFSKLPKTDLPNFQTFMKKGVHVRWIENVFPTVTRVNHMSLISGLYPESHGVIANEFYDPVFKDTMPWAGSLTDSKWVDMGSEPIWVTNSIAGEGRLSGTIYWPCADPAYKGRVPNKTLTGEWSVTEENVSPRDRIDQAFDWFTSETEPLNFVALYMNEPDEISHKYGPDSQAVLESILSRDKIVEHIMVKMQETKLEETLNIIITADHGQVPVYADQMINLDLLIDPAWYKVYSTSVHGEPMMLLWPTEGCADCYEKLIKGLKHINLHVATNNNSEDLLELHYSSNYRISPIVIWAETGWLIGTNVTNITSGSGQHGWDPRYSPLMYPFFIAMGPAFKKGLQNAEPFHIVDIYPLMCHILGITPAPNNGSLSKTAHILSSSPTETIITGSSTSYTGVAIGIIVLILGVTIIVVIIVRYMRDSKNVSSSYKHSYTKAGSVEDLMTDGTVVLSASDDDL